MRYNLIVNVNCVYKLELYFKNVQYDFLLIVKLDLTYTFECYVKIKICCVKSCAWFVDTILYNKTWYLAKHQNLISKHQIVFHQHLARLFLLVFEFAHHFHTVSGHQ